MIITVFCQYCGQSHQFDDRSANKRIACTKCGHEFTVRAFSVEKRASASEDTHLAMPIVVEPAETSRTPAGPISELEQLQSATRGRRPGARRTHGGQYTFLIGGLILLACIGLAVVCWPARKDVPSSNSDDQADQPLASPVEPVRTPTRKPADAVPYDQSDIKRAGDTLGGSAKPRQTGGDPVKTNDIKRAGDALGGPVRERPLPATTQMDAAAETGPSSTPASSPTSMPTSSPADPLTSPLIVNERVILPLAAGECLLRGGLREGGKVEAMAVWSLDPLRAKWSVQMSGGGGAPIVSPKGVYIARLAADRDEPAVEVWAESQSQPQRILLGKSGSADLVGFRNDREFLVKRWSTFSTAIEVWDAASGKMLRDITAPGWSGNGFAVSPDGSTCAIAYCLTGEARAGGQLQVAFYGLGSGTLLGGDVVRPTNSSDRLAVTGLAYSSDGRRCAMLVKNGPSWSVAIFRPLTGERTGEAALKPESAPPDDAAGFDWTPTGDAWIALGGAIFDSRTGDAKGRAVEGTTVAVRRGSAGAVAMLVRGPADAKSLAIRVVRMPAPSDAP